MNWADAQSYCRDNFMDLATARSDAENQKIQNRVPLGNWAWIGLFRDPDFYWSDGSSFIFENWDGGLNRLYSMRFICGISSLSGRWKFVACETRIPFVCYSYPKKRQVVKLRLKVEGSVDLKDPNVKADLLKKASVSKKHS
ncbi:lithostathine-like [Cololabis saira]|uniref:lithostathine-like n=1 Tax=Cololabis saira TaxID=129043 RepID=UPI002AD36EC5|nr:lithostathine-like [Cololabis saira]